MSVTSNNDFFILVSSIILISTLMGFYLHHHYRVNLLKPIFILPLLVFLTFGYIQIENKGNETFDKEIQNLKNIIPTYAHNLQHLQHDKIQLTTSPNDPYYLNIINEQKYWLELNKEISDIYTIKSKDNKNYLLVDSETDYNRNGIYDDEREQRTPLGDPYEKMILEISSALKGNISHTEKPYTDSWGTWISVLAPIYDSEERVNAVLGVDYSAEKIINKVTAERRNYIYYVLFFSLIYLLLISYSLVLKEKIKKNLELQNEITKAQSTMVKNAKFAAIGELSAGIAHEINNPLSIISGKASTLRSYIRKNNFQDKKITEELDKIENTAFRIHRIIQGLKKFSRSDKQIEKKVFSIRNCIQDALDLCLEKLKNHGIRLNFNLDHNIDYFIDGNSTLISQVFMNLFNNSFDAIQNLTDKWINIDFRFSNDNKNLVIIVTDSGVDMPEDVRKKIMTPFFTTKEVGKGTGLGLSISKGIIEEHGGKIFIDEQSRNTSFHIYLPLHSTKSEKAIKAS